MYDLGSTVPEKAVRCFPMVLFLIKKKDFLVSSVQQEIGLVSYNHLKVLHSQ